MARHHACMAQSKSHMRNHSKTVPIQKPCQTVLLRAHADLKGCVTALLLWDEKEEDLSASPPSHNGRRQPQILPPLVPKFLDLLLHPRAQLIPVLVRHPLGLDRVTDHKPNLPFQPHPQFVCLEEIARPNDSHRHNREPRLDGKDKGTLFEVLELPISAAGALGEHQHGAGALDQRVLRPLHALHRRLVVLAVDNDMPSQIHEPAEDRNVAQLLLADGDQVPLVEHAIDKGRVREGLVVCGEHVVLIQVQLPGPHRVVLDAHEREDDPRPHAHVVGHELALHAEGPRDEGREAKEE
mmetsp:Transcript_19035/g.46753  ORF Transcript_19035/g.46753 Transcript_19035/m.46753 type:complete len:296 (-) Transcript_19035:439-1326(-)